MVNLFVSYYIDSNPERQQELELCMSNNISNSEIDKVYIFIDSVTPNNFKQFPKVHPVIVSARPTFKTYFETVNKVTADDDINIVINTDIYFVAKDIELLKAGINSRDFFALTRYDMSKWGQASFVDLQDCQDSWIFQGAIPYEEMYCDFNQGKCGCDNRLAHEAQQVGYVVTNPSLTIKSYHVHNSQIKSYDRNNPEDVVAPPYLLLTPCKRDDITVVRSLDWNEENVNHDAKFMSDEEIIKFWGNE